MSADDDDDDRPLDADDERTPRQKLDDMLVLLRNGRRDSWVERALACDGCKQLTRAWGTARICKPCMEGLLESVGLSAADCERLKAEVLASQPKRRPYERPSSTPVVAMPPCMNKKRPCVIWTRGTPTRAACDWCVVLRAIVHVLVAPHRWTDEHVINVVAAAVGTCEAYPPRLH